MGSKKTIIEVICGSKTKAGVTDVKAPSPALAVKAADAAIKIAKQSIACKKECKWRKDMSSITVVSNPGSDAGNYTFDAIWQFTIFCSKFEDTGIASSIRLQK